MNLTEAKDKLIESQDKLIVSLKSQIEIQRLMIELLREMVLGKPTDTYQADVPLDYPIDQCECVHCEQARRIVDIAHNPDPRD